ncbi:hypothetical protein DV738_g2218, partial [Chaetothyriales sp. CBS 135597]
MAPTATPSAQGEGEGDQDADALLASLEEEDDSAYREQRLQQLNAEAQHTQRSTLTSQKSAYVTLKSDDDALRFTTEHERAVVHFFHPEFARCSTMDGHCEHIATRYAEHGSGDVAFGRIDVKNAPFVVQKLGVRVLPCIIGFVKGVVAGRVTGFEGIAWNSNEASKAVTLALEERLVEWAVLTKRFLEDVEDFDDDEDDGDSRLKNGSSGRRGIGGRKQTVTDEDDDWD